MKFINYICMIFLLCACTDGLERLPETATVLPKEKMVEVLEDMVKLESHIQLKYRNVGEYHKVMITSGDSLLIKHGITRAQFDESMDFYGSRQDEMQGIYADVLDRLNKELGELQSEN